MAHFWGFLYLNTSQADSKYFYFSIKALKSMQKPKADDIYPGVYSNNSCSK